MLQNDLVNLNRIHQTNEIMFPWKTVIVFDKYFQRLKKCNSCRNVHLDITLELLSNYSFKRFTALHTGRHTHTRLGEGLFVGKDLNPIIRAFCLFHNEHFVPCYSLSLRCAFWRQYWAKTLLTLFHGFSPNLFVNVCSQRFSPCKRALNIFSCLSIVFFDISCMKFDI